MPSEPIYTAFSGARCIASGSLRDVLRAAKGHTDRSDDLILIFEDRSGRQVDFDLRGTLDQVLEREAPIRRQSGPGRPRLGVVSREISLLPRHWEWLEQQPRGISATLRRLVEDARKQDPDEERARRAAEAASRFMWAMAGNLPGFEEASRALFRREGQRFEQLTRDWPADVRDHAARLAAPAFATGAPARS